MAGGSRTKKKGANSKAGSTTVPHQGDAGGHQVGTARQAGGVHGPTGNKPDDKSTKADRSKPAAIRGTVACTLSRKHEAPLEPSGLAKLGPESILFWVLTQFALLVTLFLLWEAGKLNPYFFPRGLPRRDADRGPSPDRRWAVSRTRCTA